MVRSAVPLGAVSVPAGDAAFQVALYGAGLESLSHLEMQPEVPWVSEVVETLMCFRHQGFNMRGPW